jgi:muramidase (phage lysozyme)
MSIKVVITILSSVLLLAACGQAGDTDSLWQTVGDSESSELFVIVGAQDTFLKISVEDSSKLINGKEKCVLESGKKYPLSAQPSFESGHLFLRLSEKPTGCELSQGYVFRAHVNAPSLKSSLSSNMRAFLDMLAYAEGTNDSYDIIFGYRKFYSYAGHPRILNCSGGYCSDAAGRYQIKSTTWDEVRREVGLTDFTPESQDRAAVQLIKWRGAYSQVEQISNFDQFDNAVYSVRYEWASMPYSPYGQPTHSASRLWSKFKEFRARY